MENFEKNKFKNPKNTEVEEYLNAYKEWEALSNQLSNLFRKKNFLTITEDLNIYKMADQRLIDKANKINAPLPDNLLLDLAHKYLKILVQEIKGRFKDELDD